MQDTTDRTYWAARAEAELARARDARDPAASKAHYELAGLYLNLVHGGEPVAPGELQRRPQLRVVAG